jgi:hypothetical protein
MPFNNSFCSLILAAAVTSVLGCAAQPAPTDVPKAPPANSAAMPPVSPTDEARTEADAASALEKKFQEAAKGYKVVERDGKTMYCKREKVIGSTIPTMQCITESQLRNQVETMEELRGRMRNTGRCTLGPGCSAGGG